MTPGRVLMCPRSRVTTRPRPVVQIPAGQMYKTPGEAYVEGDASSASYFLAGATITGGTITVEGCGSDSLQGDVRFAEVGTARLGCDGREA